MFCKWHPTPRCFAMQTRCKNQLINGCKGAEISVDVLQMGGGCARSTPLLRDVGTMQKMSRVARSLCVLIVVDGLQMGGLRPPQPPLLFGNATAKNNLSTVARSQCVLIFVRVLDMDFGVYRPPKPPRTPTVPFCPFYFGVFLLKLNSKKKGTLIINGLLGNLVFRKGSAMQSTSFERLPAL